MSKKFLMIFTIIKFIISIDESNIYNKELSSEKDLFKEYYNEANDLLKNMTIEEKIGQIFYARFNDNISKEIKANHYGGLTLFANDFEKKNKSIIQKELRELNNISKINLSFAVDEEGGTVNRISLYKQYRDEPFKSPQNYYNEGGIKKVLEIEKEKINLIKDLNLNINFAPVADYTTNTSAYIYKRTLGQNITETEKYISEVVKQGNNNNFTTCLKHFPGYGGNSDTHKGMAIDTRNLEEFRKNDFKPFIAGINEKVPMIMVSHNIIEKVDPNYPSSLSAKIHKILREELNYSGIIITDDISMGAITEFIKNESIATIAILSGVDIILTSNNTQNYQELLKDFKDNKVKENQINNAVTRILAYKLKYGIIKSKTNPKKGGSNLIAIILIILAVVLVGAALVYFFVIKKKGDSHGDLDQQLTDDNGF